MAKKEKAIYKFVRRGNSLIPEMEFDLRALDGIAQGQGVRVEIGQWRNMDRLRAYWCTLQDCIDATGCAPHKEALDAFVRPAVGHCDYVRLANGNFQAVPRPINTRDCDEPEMIAFFQAVEECLARNFGFVSERKSAAA
jgi:hypothetical protein